MEALLYIIVKYEKLRSEVWKVCILDQSLRRNEVEFIDPSNRRVVGEAAAALWCLDQPLYSVWSFTLRRRV